MWESRHGWWIHQFVRRILRGLSARRSMWCSLLMRGGRWRNILRYSPGILRPISSAPNSPRYSEILRYRWCRCSRVWRRWGLRWTSACWWIFPKSLGGHSHLMSKKYTSLPARSLISTPPNSLRRFYLKILRSIRRVFAKLMAASDPPRHPSLQNLPRSIRLPQKLCDIVRRQNSSRPMWMFYPHLLIHARIGYILHSTKRALLPADSLRKTRICRISQSVRHLDKIFARHLLQDRAMSWCRLITHKWSCVLRRLWRATKK